MQFMIVLGLNKYQEFAILRILGNTYTLGVIRNTYKMLI